MKKIYEISLILIIGLTVAIAVTAWTNPTGNPTAGGGALYYSGGNVGIGTAAPGAKLDVNGNIAIAEGASIGPASFGHNSGHDNAIKFGQSGGSWGGVKVINYFDGSFNNQYVTFDTHHGGVSVGERMRIDRDGNVGIGTANPQAKLHVGGVAGTDGIMFPDGTLQTTASSAGYGTQSTNNTQISLAVNNTWYEAVKISSFPCNGNDVLINATVSTLYQGYAVDYFIRLKIGGVVVVTNRFSQDYNEDPQLHVTWLSKSCSGTSDIAIEVSKSGASASINPTGYPAVLNAVRFPWSS